MKSFIKKAFVVLIVLATFVDWPVKVEAGGYGVVAVPLLRSCTRVAEKNVNKSTQISKDLVNRAARNQTLKYGSMRAAGQLTVVVCPVCHGTGNVQGFDGHSYNCHNCKGAGRVVRRR